MSTSNYAQTNSRPAPKSKGFIGENLLTILTIIGVVGGTIMGLVLKNSGQTWTEREVMYIQYPGDLFLRYAGLKYLKILYQFITYLVTECSNVLLFHLLCPQLRVLLVH